MMRYSKGEISKNILFALVAVGAVAVFVVFPGMPAVLSLFKLKNKKETISFNRSLYDLRKNGFIEMKRKGRSYSLKMTNKGKARLVKYNFDGLSLVKKNKWDGFWRLVTFDIPETKRGARIAISRKLKELGFFPFQKSMFVYPYNCKEEIDFIKDYFNSHDYIKYFLVKDFEGNKKLKQHFGL